MVNQHFTNTLGKETESLYSVEKCTGICQVRRHIECSVKIQILVAPASSLVTNFSLVLQVQTLLPVQ